MRGRGIACPITEIFYRQRKPQLATKLKVLPEYNLLRLRTVCFLLLTALFTG